jgi:hypothetical protein
MSEEFEKKIAELRDNISNERDNALTKSVKGLNRSCMNSMKARLSSKKRGKDGKIIYSMRAQKFKAY